MWFYCNFLKKHFLNAILEMDFDFKFDFTELKTNPNNQEVRKNQNW